MEDEFFDIPSGHPVFKREEKLVVHLKPVANAPILKQTKFKIPGNEEFGTIVNFIRKQLRTSDSIFLYINSVFSPTADTVLGDLFECFKIGEELIINYAVTEAWG